MASGPTLSYHAELSGLRKELAQIEGITNAEARKAVAALGKQWKKAERDSGKMAKQAAKQWGDAFTALPFGGIVQQAITNPLMGVVAASAAAAAGIWKLTNDLSESVDKMNYMSASTGLSTETLGSLEYALGAAGLDLEKFRTGLTSFTQAMDTGKGGFKRLGIETKDADGRLRDVNVVLMETMNALAGVGNETERTAIAIDLFGARGAALGRVMGDVAGDLDEGANAARRWYGPEAQAASVAMDKAMRDMNAAVKDLSTALAIELTPQVVALVGALADVLGPVLKVNAAFVVVRSWTAYINPVKLAMMGLAAATKDAADESRALSVESGLVIDELDEGAPIVGLWARLLEKRKQALLEQAEREKAWADAIRATRKQLESQAAALQRTRDELVATTDKLTGFLDVASGLEGVNIAEPFELTAEQINAIGEAAAAAEVDVGEAAEGMKTSGMEVAAFWLEMADSIVGAWSSATGSMLGMLQTQLSASEQAQAEMEAAGNLSAAQAQLMLAQQEDLRGKMHDWFEVDKAGKVAQIGITTALAVMEAVSALAGIPIAGPALAAAAGIAIGAAGAIQIAAVESEANPYPTGGMVDHRLAYVQPGEGIVNRPAMQRLGGKQALDRINDGRVVGTTQPEVVIRFRERDLARMILDTGGRRGWGLGGRVPGMSPVWG